jgi:hypothetical protein
VPHGELGDYSIQLQPGWNIIGSPFNAPVPWNAVVEHNPSISPTSKLWAFDESFTEATHLEP